MQRLPKAAIAAVASVLLLTLVLGGSALAQSDSSASDLRQSFLDRLAENLGVSRGELDTTIEQTGAEVIDGAVDNGHLGERRANVLRGRLETNGFFSSGEGRNDFGRGRVGFGRGGETRHFGMQLDLVAEQLGLTTEELTSQLQDGATLSEIITVQGSTTEAVVDALVAAVPTDLEQKVADGTITQERADEILGALPGRLAEQIENGRAAPFRCGRTGNSEEPKDSSI